VTFPGTLSRVTVSQSNDGKLQPNQDQQPPQIPEVSGLRPIGRGGFATVYRGTQARLGRDVAVKVFHATVMDPWVRQQFEAECAAVGGLPSDIGIVHIYSSGVVPGSGQPYLVMELCRGSLHERIADQGALPAAEVATLGYRLALALAGLHRAALLHRDITPRNVLFRQSGQPVLADFGLSLRGEHADQAQDFATWAYAAPEIWSGGASSRSDIYSLGATLYTALAGAPPFPRQAGEEDSAYSARIISEPAPPLGDALIPNGLVALIAGMLAKDPGDRPVDADAVAIGLAAFCPVQRSEGGELRSGIGRADVSPLSQAEMPQAEMPRTGQTHGNESDDATRLRPTRQVAEGRAAAPGTRHGRRWLVPGAATLAIAAVFGAAFAVTRHGPPQQQSHRSITSAHSASPTPSAGATGGRGPAPATSPPQAPQPGQNPTPGANAPANPNPNPSAGTQQPGPPAQPAPPTGGANLDISTNYAWARGSVSWNGTTATANGQVQDTQQYDSHSWVRIAYRLNINGTWKVQYAQPDPYTNVSNGQSKTFSFSVGGPVKDVQWDLCSSRLDKTYCTGWR
jgi:serine/threonine protein kinase